MAWDVQRRPGMRPLAQLGTLLIAGSVACGALAPSAARACSGYECTPSKYFPSTGTLPANLPGILFWPGRTNFSDDDAGVDIDDPSAVLARMRFARIDGAHPELRPVK